MNAEKTALRRLLAGRIQALSNDDVAQSDAGIFENIIALPEFQKAEAVFTYYSLGREPDTRKIVDYALRQGKTVALPVCARCGVMDARAIGSPDELVLSSYQLLEPLNSTRIIPPEVFDFIIVPALTYDLDGFRLGYGGGYYDRYLTKTNAFTAGVARENLLMDAVPRETHDVAVHCVVTEKRARRLRLAGQRISDGVQKKSETPEAREQSGS